MGVDAVGVDDLGGLDRLAAVVAVGVGLDVALVEQAMKRLERADMAQVEQDLVPEAGVQQVQHGVLDATDIQVDTAGVAFVLGAHPVLLDLGIDEGIGVGRIEVAQLVPARPRPLGHDVDFATVGGRAVAEVEFDVEPLGGACQRRHRIGDVVVGVHGGRTEVFEFGQRDRELVVGDGMRATLGVVDDRERLAPVALAGEQPVTQAVGDGRFARSLRLEPGGGAFLGLGHVRDAVEIERFLGGVGVGGVDVRRIAGVGGGPGRGVERRLEIVLGEPGGRRLLDRWDGQAELGGELEVSFVAARHGHDGAGAVAHQDVVGDPDRNLCPVDRVGGERSGEGTGLLSGVVGPILVVGGGRGGDIGLDLGLLIGGRQLGDQRVLGGEHHERGAEQGVGPGGEDLDVAGGGTEPNGGATRPADPVALHDLDGLGPVQGVEIFEQAIGIGGDAQHPLLHVALEDRVVADVGATLGGDFFVGQDGSQSRAPVDGSLRQIGQAVLVDHGVLLGRRQLGPCPAVGGGAGAGFEGGDELGDGASFVGLGVVPGVEDLEEDPLGPAVEVLVGGGDTASFVVGQAQTAQLAAHVGDVLFGVDPRVDAGVDGVLLCRQAERVVAQGVQDVEALHAFVPTEDVGTDVAQRMADVQALAGRVGEHVEDEQLRAIADGLGVGHGPGGVRSVEGAVGFPGVLPPGLDLVRQRGVVAEGGEIGAARAVGCGIAGSDGGGRSGGGRSVGTHRRPS